MEQPVTKTLDTKGLLCPEPIVRTGKAIKEIAVGQVREVLATDPASKPDMQAWSKMTGNKVLAAEEQAGSPKVYRYLVQRTR